MKLQLFLLVISTMSVVVASQSVRYVAINGTDSSNDCSNARAPCKTISHAVDQADAGDVIKIFSGTYQEASTINVINTSLSFITASGLADVVIDAPPSSSIFAIERAAVSFDSIELNGMGGGGYSSCLSIMSDSRVKLTGLFVHDCKGSSGNGGAINVRNSSILKVVSCKFTNNTAFYYAGVIYNEGQIEVSHCTFVNNTARAAGVIYNNGLVDVSGCAFISNSASSSGVILNNGGQIKVSDCTFAHNTAPSDGGVIYNSGLIDVSGCTFINNSATDSFGGGVIFNAGHIKVSGCTFTKNTALYFGGVIYNNGLIDVSGCTFTSNSASSSYGGGVIYNGGQIYMSGCAFMNNTAFSNGGVIYNDDDGQIAVSDCTFTNNTAFNSGGAIYTLGVASMRESTFTHSRAFNFGGAIAVVLGQLDIRNTTISFCNASQGGGVYAALSSKRITANNLLVLSNTATLGGGMYFANYGPNQLSNSSIINNAAYDYGGGIYFAEDSTTVNDSMFECNVAGIEGDAYFSNASSLVCNDCAFTSNCETTVPTYREGES